jgi:hypothetical protein
LYEYKNRNQEKDDVAVNNEFNEIRL